MNFEWPKHIQEIIGGNLILRQFSEVDAQYLFELIEQNRDHLNQFGDDTSAKYPIFDAVLQSITRPINPNKRRFGVYNLEGKLVGTINATPIDQETIEIGYWIGKDFNGQGFATNSCKLLINYIFSTTSVSNIIAQTHPENLASARVLMKAGLEHEGKDPDDGFLIFRIGSQINNLTT